MQVELIKCALRFLKSNLDSDVEDMLDAMYDSRKGDREWEMEISDTLDAFELMTKAPDTGINPVTFTPMDKGKLRLVLSRLHFGTENAMTKAVIAAMHMPDEVPASQDVVQFDEDHFILGLKHLFPNGELNG